MNHRTFRMFLVLLPAAALVGLPFARAAQVPAAAAEPEIHVTVTPTVRWVHVDGNAAKFREDTGINDGWAGGVDQLLLTQQLGNDWQVTAEARAIFDEEDYKLRLEIANPEIGFVRAGWTQYRQYYNDVGGSYRPFSTSSFSLQKELFLRHGDIFIEAGLTLPNLPKLTVGYERQYRDGNKSLLEWGNVQEDTTNRRIYPSVKDVDETVDIVKVTLEHDISKVHLADQFRYEHFRSDTDRTDTSFNLNTSASKTVTVHENYTHDDFFNTFVMDTHLSEKVYCSLGYLYNTLSGDGGLRLGTTPFDTPFDHNWQVQSMDVGVDSHVVNLNTLFGPFAGLSFNLGLQAEDTQTHGFSDALLSDFGAPASANLIHTSNDKQSLEETAGLRYTKIPFTTLYAEGRWTEQQIDLAERETDNGALAFRRSTDTDVFRQDYRVGFNTAPLSRITLAGRYRYRLSQNDYDQQIDTMPGYPAFLTGQDLTTDEVMAKLGWRPCTFFRAAFTYQLVSTRIDTSNETVPLLAPKGSRQSSEYDANIYSVSATVNPTARLYVTGLFSLQDASTTAFDNGAASVRSFDGNVYSVIGMLGYAVTENTDFTLEYLYSRADSYAGHAATGLPVGLDYQRQGLNASLRMKLAKNLIAKLGYGFYDYDENHEHGVNDYTAHLGSGSVTLKF